jgi:hypothetical protein
VKNKLVSGLKGLLSGLRSDKWKNTAENVSGTAFSTEIVPNG